MRRISTAAVLVLAALIPTVAQAQTTPFNIDGTIPDAGTTQSTDPTGGAKELGPVNGTNTKVGVIHDALPPMLDFTNPNGQVDLVNIWMDTRKDGAGEQWLYFAWQRDSRTGSGVIAFEFQQAGLPTSCVYTGADIDMILPQSAGEASLINNCNPFQNRQPGDFLIIWDQAGSTIAIRKRVFMLDPDSGALVLGPSSPALGSATAAIGGNGFFGEASLNLTDDVFPSDGSCVNFANIIPGTITGNSDTADYKDVVLSEFEPISNCGSVRIAKVTDPVGLSAPSADAFQYTLARAAGNVRFDGTTSIVQSLEGHGDFDDHTLLIAAGNYTLVEAAQVSPWQLVSIVCEIDGVSAGPSTGFTVEPGATTVCTITNKLLQGSITVIKIVQNDNGGSALASDFTISLGDPANTQFSGSETGTTFTLPAGTTFNVSESPVSGYTQLSIVGDCGGEIEAGVSKVCTITNDDNAPALTLNKIVVNDNGGTLTEADWTLTANGGGAGTLSGAGAAGSADVVSGLLFQQGTYALSETSANPGSSGYSASGWTCVKNGVPIPGTVTSIVLGLGDTAVCTITNDDAKASPAGNTVQRAILHDRLNITTGIRRGDGEGALTVTFKLYKGTNCDAAPIGQETVDFQFTSPGATSGFATTVSGFLVDTSDSYRWRVAFSGNTFNDGFETACGSEVTTITFIQ